MKKTFLIILCASSLVATSCNNNAKTNEKEVTITTTVTDSSIVSKTVFSINEIVNGKKVDLKVENGNINSLIIDGKTIEQQDFGKYTDLTEGILKNLPKSPEPPAPPAAPNAPNVGQSDVDEMMNKGIEEQMKKDGIFKEGNVKYEFDLTQDELTINGKVQSKEKLSKYLEIINKTTGKDISKKLHIKLREDRVEK